MKTRPHYFSLQGRRQDLLREGSGFPAEAVRSQGAPCPPRMTLWGWTWVSAPSPGARCRRPQAGCRKQAHRGGDGEAEARHPASPEGDTGHARPPPAPGNGAFHRGRPGALRRPPRAPRFLDTRWRPRRPLGKEEGGVAGGEASCSSAGSLRSLRCTLYPPSPRPLCGRAAARRWRAGGSGRRAAGGAVAAGAAAIMLGEPGLGRGAGWRERAVPSRAARGVGARRDVP